MKQLFGGGRILVFLSVLLAWTTAANAGPGLEEYVLSLNPKPGEVVARDDLFVLVRLDEALAAQGFDPTTMSLEIDTLDVSARSTRSVRHLSYQVTDPLRLGTHSIRLSLDVPGDGRKVLEWTFELSRQETESLVSHPEVMVDGQPVDRAHRELLTRAPGVVADGNRGSWSSGKLSFSSEQVDLTGPGRGLRNQPASTNILDFSGTTRSGPVEITHDLYLTSDDEPNHQHRDRIRLGVQYGPVEVEVGDANPVYQDLVLKGLRVRGGSVRAQFGGLSVGVSHGDLKRATRVAEFNPVASFRRRMTAARIENEFRSANLRIGFTFLRAEDLEASSDVAKNPLENTVYGGDIEFRPSNAWRFYGELAQSDTEGDLLFERYGIDDTSTAFRAGFEVDFRDGRDRLMTELYRTGTGYRSLGRNTLTADKEGVRLRATNHFRGRAIRLDTDFGLFRDNLEDQIAATRDHTSVGARLRFNLGRSRPIIGVRGRFFSRADDLPATDRFAVDEQTVAYGVSIRQGARWGGGRSDFYFDIGRNDRDNRVRDSGDSDSTTATLILNHRFRQPWWVRLRLSTNDRQIGGNMDVDMNIVDVMVRGDVIPERLRLELTGSGRYSDGSLPGFDSRRVFGSLSGVLDLAQDFALRLGYRRGEFEDHRVSDNNYEESTFFVSIKREFDLGNF